MKKVVLITGASSGIGKETAKALASKGFAIYAVARRVDRMQELKEHGIRVFQMDVTDEESMIKVVNEIINSEKQIDVLINNAGYGSFGALEDVSISEAKKQFEVNIFGLARLTQIVLPHMRERRAGRIINVSSMGGKFGEPHGVWYHSTKFALEGLSDCLRMELDQFGIDVVIIEPGMIKTQWDMIARENLIKASGSTAYRDLALKHADSLSKNYKKGSEPTVIAEAIVKAVMANRPKTRYVAGAMANFILFVKRILPDRIFDAIMLGQLK
ncbi:MAG TPA: short-chain dehydrogenase/reductase [Lentisphaeria bacterium]|nr:MAG: short-chain dehydrogenase/reductase [Lentisphaerae bacterium GWF2_38_69]HBM14896.1 short-chain dehydrogenase/reductase [Lentisphaeria bacterium]